MGPKKHGPLFVGKFKLCLRIQLGRSYIVWSRSSLSSCSVSSSVPSGKEDVKVKAIGNHDKASRRRRRRRRQRVDSVHLQMKRDGKTKTRLDLVNLLSMGLPINDGAKLGECFVMVPLRLLQKLQALASVKCNSQNLSLHYFPSWQEID